MMTIATLVLIGIAAGIMWCIAVDPHRHNLQRWRELWRWYGGKDNCFDRESAARYRRRFIVTFIILTLSGFLWAAAVACLMGCIL